MVSARTSATLKTKLRGMNMVDLATIARAALAVVIGGISLIINTH
jgi:hypothetical protein